MKKLEIPPVAELLDEDEAARHLKSLSRDERRPRLDSNKLGKTGTSFSAEECAAAFDSFMPD